MQSTKNIGLLLIAIGLMGPGSAYAASQERVPLWKQGLALLCAWTCLVEGAVTNAQAQYCEAIPPVCGQLSMPELLFLAQAQTQKLVMGGEDSSLADLEEILRTKIALGGEAPSKKAEARIKTRVTKQLLKLGRKNRMDRCKIRELATWDTFSITIIP